MFGRNKNLVSKAKALGIENAEALNKEELQDAINRTEIVNKATELGLTFNKEEATEVIAEMVKLAEEENKQANKPGDDDVTEVEEPTFTYKGREYSWSDRTPEKFRYNDEIKSKADWMKDADAMEQMVLGRLHYLIPKK